MGLKGIGKRIGGVALRLAVLSCGGECAKCGNCANMLPHALEDKGESHIEKEK